MVANFRLELNVDVVIEQVVGVARWLCQAAEKGSAAHEVERTIFQTVLEMGQRLFGGYLRMAGDGDLGEQVTLPDGRVVQRLEDAHERRLQTVFGEFSLSRRVSGTEERKVIELIPTDQRLQLPEGKVSYLLQEWDQLLGVEQAYGRVRDTLNSILRIKQSVDTLEHGTRQMAESAPAFREQQPAPEPDAEGEFLIVTEDNKGIPMVRPVDAPPPGAHLTKGQKKNKKRMACVGCVYSVDPHVRTPEELVATLFRDPDRPKLTPPKAQHKRYWASLTREIAGTEICGQTEVFEHLRDDLALRRQPRQKLINLSDGQRSLETDRHDDLPRDEHTVDILDLMHVLPRLWEAAHLFHAEASDEAQSFVRQRLRRVLEGQAKSVIADFRRQGTNRKLRGAKRKTLDRLTRFLESNLHRMRYDEYLAAGYPIATGVIEGACRHLVKDRMERSGMRWKVPGAQALLALRTIHTNGDWQDFQDFRVRYETERLYPHAEKFQAISWPLKSITV